MNPKFTISILAYGGVEYTRRCLKSVIEASRDDAWELILTDNASNDGTLELFEVIQEAYPDRVRIVQNSENRGFIEPNLHALSLAQGEFFVLLNNDAEVPHGWLRMLEEPFDRHESCALTGAQGGCTSLSADLLGQPAGALEYLEGSCLMGRADFLRKIGLFSPKLHFAYFEDSDLSLRVRELGHTIHQAPFTLVHHRSVTSKRVLGIEEIKAHNHAYMRKRWAHYGKVRRMDYPIVIKRKGATGDVLLTTPIIREFALRRPNCPIYVETECVAVLRNNPHVSHVSKRLLPQRDALVIDLNMAYENRPGRHYVDAYAEAADLERYALKTDFYPTKLEVDHADKLLGLARWCAVHPGPTGWPGRDWPFDRWQEVIDWLMSNGWKVLLVGHSTEPLVCNMDLRNKTSLHQLGATLMKCRLFVGIDSFPLHCAQAMGVPVVPLFGVSLPQFVLTHGSGSFPVVGIGDGSGARHTEMGKTYVEDGVECMLSIQPAQVIEAIQRASCSVAYQPLVTA